MDLPFHLSTYFLLSVCFSLRQHQRKFQMRLIHLPVSLKSKADKQKLLCTPQGYNEKLVDCLRSVVLDCNIWKDLLSRSLDIRIPLVVLRLSILYELTNK